MPPRTAQHGVDAGQCRGKGAVPGGDHHPEPAPGHPGTEQAGRPPADLGALGPVVLCPHPWFGHPRPVGAAVAEVIGRLGRGDRTAGGALVAAKAHGHEVVLVHHVGPHLAVRALHQLLDLLEVRVDDLLRAPARTGSRRRRGWPRSGPRSSGRPRSALAAAWAQWVRSKASRISMMCLPDLVIGPPVGCSTAIRTPSRTPHRRAVLVDDADFCCPPTWSSAVRQRGVCCPPTWSMSCPWSERRNCGVLHSSRGGAGSPAALFWSQSAASQKWMTGLRNHRYFVVRRRPSGR